MAASEEVFQARYPRFDESLLNITAHVARWRPVKRQVSAFRADDNFVSRKAFVSQGA
jgi:hypothetical protein